MIAKNVTAWCQCLLLMLSAVIGNVTAGAEEPPTIEVLRLTILSGPSTRAGRVPSTEGLC